MELLQRKVWRSFTERRLEQLRRGHSSATDITSEFKGGVLSDWDIELCWEYAGWLGLVSLRGHEIGFNTNGIQLSWWVQSANARAKKHCKSNASRNRKQQGSQPQANKKKECTLFPQYFSFLLHAYWQRLAGSSWQSRKVVCRVPGAASQEE